MFWGDIVGSNECRYNFQPSTSRCDMLSIGTTPSFFEARIGIQGSCQELTRISSSCRYKFYLTFCHVPGTTLIGKFCHVPFVGISIGKYFPKACCPFHHLSINILRILLLLFGLSAIEWYLSINIFYSVSNYITVGLSALKCHALLCRGQV